MADEWWACFDWELAVVSSVASGGKNVWAMRSQAGAWERWEPVRY